MGNINFEIEKFPDEIANKLFELSKDMDFLDYEEEKKQILSDLENVLYYLKAVAENPYNAEYFRTLYRILENI